MAAQQAEGHRQPQDAYERILAEREHLLSTMAELQAAATMVAIKTKEAQQSYSRMMLDAEIVVPRAMTREMSAEMFDMRLGLGLAGVFDDLPPMRYPGVKPFRAEYSWRDREAAVTADIAKAIAQLKRKV